MIDCERKNEFVPKVGPLCNFCSFKPNCPAHKKTNEQVEEDQKQSPSSSNQFKSNNNVIAS